MSHLLQVNYLWIECVQHFLEGYLVVDMICFLTIAYLCRRRLRSAQKDTDNSNLNTSLPQPNEHLGYSSWQADAKLEIFSHYISFLMMPKPQCINISRIQPFQQAMRALHQRGLFGYHVSGIDRFFNTELLHVIVHWLAQASILSTNRKALYQIYITVELEFEIYESFWWVSMNVSAVLFCIH